MNWQTIARRQHGVITRRQLLALGLSRWDVAQLVARGHLVTERTQGVYRSTTVPSSALTQAWSAVLAARAALSHESAAGHWGMDVPPTAVVHVTTPDRRRTRPPIGVRIHRVALREEEVVERHGLRVTSRARTVLDCCGSMPDGRARTLFDRALQQRWITVDDIARRLVLERGRWGNRRLRRLASTALVGESELERLFHALLRQAGILGWAPNVPVQAGGRLYEADVLFRTVRVVVELDGRLYHSSDQAFQADRTKQNALVADGWTVVRFTWRDLVDRPDASIAQLRVLLARAA